jgi:deoxyribodipyrimidine photo-lyase
LHPYLIEPHSRRLVPGRSASIPTLAELGFEKADLAQGRYPTGISGAQTLLDDFLQRIGSYDTSRDFSVEKGPSHLSMRLRFGTVSIRQLVRTAYAIVRTQAGGGAATWLAELIWRDFYFMILHTHPHVAECAFKPAYDAIRWESGPTADVRFAA